MSELLMIMPTVKKFVLVAETRLYRACWIGSKVVEWNPSHHQQDEDFVEFYCLHHNHP